MGSKEDYDSIPKLADTASFPLWDLEVNIFCGSKQLCGVVDGTEPKPAETDENKLSKWLQKDATAKLILLRTVENSVKTHLLTCSTAAAMYKSIIEFYKKEDEQTKGKLLGDSTNLWT